MNITPSTFANFLAFSIWHRATDSDWVAEQIEVALNARGFKCTGRFDEDLLMVQGHLESEWNISCARTQSDASRILILEGLRRYKPGPLDRKEFQLLSSRAIEDYLENDKRLYLSEYSRFGLRHADPPKVLVVDQYPKPYEHLTGNALAPDRTDQERYGMERAIYFRRAKFTPVISSLILAHELAHTFIPDDGELARGLEEGLADFWAHCVITRRRLSRSAILNHFSTRRISYGRTSQRFHVYADNLRRVYWLYKQFGISALASKMKVGRRELKRIEEALSDPSRRGSILRRSWRQGKIDDEMADEVCLLAMENETYSPLALQYCLQQANETKHSIITDAEADILKELEKRTFAVLLGDNGNVEFNDYRGVARSFWARFDPHF